MLSILSGCFVDEEPERSPGSTSTASPNGKQTSPGQQLKKNSRTSIEDISSPQQSANVQNVTPSDKEMSQGETNGSTTDATSASSPRANVKTSQDGTSELEQQSDEFYCLYYSSSPNSTLEKPCNSQGKKPPPVLPKPKSKRASVPVFPTNDPIFAQIEKLETEFNKNVVSSGEQDDVTLRRRRRHTMDGSLPCGDGVTLEALGDRLAWEQTFQERIKRFEALGETQPGAEKTRNTSKHDPNSFRGTETYNKNNCFQYNSVAVTTESITMTERKQMVQQAFLTTQQDKHQGIANTSNEQMSSSSDNVSLDDEIESFLDELDELSPLPGEDDSWEEVTSGVKGPLLAGAKGASDIEAPLLSVANGGETKRNGPTDSNKQAPFSLEITSGKVLFPNEVRGQEVPLAMAEDIVEPQYEFDEFVVYHDEEDEQDEFGVTVPEVFSSEDEDADDDQLDCGREAAVNTEQSDSLVVDTGALSDAATDGFATDASGYISECSTVTLDDSVDLSALPVFSRSMVTPPARGNGPSTERWITEQNLHNTTEQEIEAETKRRPLSNLGRRPGSFCGVLNESTKNLKNQSNALKRRSWSVCDRSTERDEDLSPFIRKVYQTADQRSAAKSNSLNETAASRYQNEVFGDAQKIPETPETNLLSSTLSPVGKQTRLAVVDKAKSQPVLQKPALRVEVTSTPTHDAHAPQRRVLSSSTLSDRLGDSDSIPWLASPQRTSGGEWVRPNVSPTSGLDENQWQQRSASTRLQPRRFSPAGSVENLRTQTLRKLSWSNTASESGAVRHPDRGFVSEISASPGRYSAVSSTPFSFGAKKQQSLSERFTNILEYAHSQEDEDVKEMIEEALRNEPEQFLEDEELERVLLTAEALNVKQLLGGGFPAAPPDMEPEAPRRSPRTTACQTDDEEEFGLRRQTSDRETQTSQLQLAEKALSAEDLLKLLSNVSDLRLGSDRQVTSPASGAGASGSPQRSDGSDRLSPSPSALHASDTGLHDQSRRPRRPLSIQR